MRILIVNDYGALVGGAEHMALTLRDGLRQRGHEVRIFTSSAEANKGSFADHECFGTTSSLRTLLQTANPFAYRRLRQVLAAFHPDVVHVKVFLTQLSPLILPLLREVPSIYHAEWHRPICPLGTKMLPNGSACQVSWGALCYQSGCLPLRDWLPLMLQMRLWQRWQDAFDLVVANSHPTKHYLEASDLRVDEVVWNGVPAPPLRASPGSPPTVVFAGRLVPEKGVDVLLHAFSHIASHVPAARLLIAGDGPEAERLKQLIATLEISDAVSMLGYVSREEMERRFASAWVQVVPSRWAEPFGIVAAEAMMRGTAVVASRSGGLADIVRENKTGFLTPPGDAERLASALLRLLQDRALAERLGRAGRETAQAQFSEAAYVEQFVRLYERLQQRHAKHAAYSQQGQ